LSPSIRQILDSDHFSSKHTGASVVLWQAARVAWKANRAAWGGPKNRRSVLGWRGAKWSFSAVFQEFLGVFGRGKKILVRSQMRRAKSLTGL
jgi:hypothetical protein